MGLLDKLLGPPALATRSGSWPLSQVPGKMFNLRMSDGGTEVTEDDALSLSAVFAAVNLLSRITAALPLNVMQRVGRNREVADSHPAQWLLHTEFNPETTAVVGRRTVEFHRLLGGNGYAEITWRGNGHPAALWPLEHWRVQPKRDESKQLYYLVDGTRKVMPADMLHFTLTSSDGVCGRSFLEWACTSLGLSISAQTFAERFFRNGARPGVILSHEGNPDVKQRTEMKEGWQRDHGGPDKSHGTAVIWGGWKVSEHGGGLSPADSQLVDQRRFGVEEVARWLNIPPHLLRDLSRSTNNNIEHQGIEFVQLTLGPTLVETEQEYDRKLLSPPKVYSKHNVTALLRGDMKARAEFYTKMFSVGGVTVNKILDLEDENPIGPDGDVHFVPVNLQPLERAVKPPEPAAPPSPPAAQPPAKEEPPTEPKDDGPTPEMRAALRGLVADTFARLLKKETNEGRRAAKKPGEFLQWADRFYADYRATLALALRPAFGVADSMRVGLVRPEAIADAYVERSKEALLDMAGKAKFSEFPAAAEHLFAEWDAQRAARETRILLGD